MLETLLLLSCQGPMTALASTSSDTRLPQDPVVHDEAWIRREHGPPGAKGLLTKMAQMALVGDLDGDGMFDALPGVDALAYWPAAPTSTPNLYDFVFSTVSSVGSYEDGDLLRFDPAQGLQVEVPEADFLTLLQPASGSFDLDAASYDALGDALWFSVGANLTATVLGDVADGDILVWEFATGVVWRAYTEAEVQAQVDLVTGGGNAVGDVLALSFLPGTGQLGLVVQSPSSLDASVVAVDPAAVLPTELLSGWEEADWDFQQATEIDALAFVDATLPQAPVLDLDLPTYAVGEIVRFKLRHAVPGSMAQGFRARQVAFDARPGVGIGFLFLDPNDPLLQAQVRHGYTYPQRVDPSGTAVHDWVVPPLPSGMATVDLYFQALDDQGGGWSAPVVIRIQ